MRLRRVLRWCLLGLGCLVALVGLAGAGGYGVWRWFRADGATLRLDQGSLGMLNQFAASLAFDRRGTRLLACGGRGPVVWSLPDGGQRHRGMTGRLGRTATDAERICAFSPDGKLVAGAQNPWWPRPERPGVLTLWEVESGKVVHELDQSEEHVDSLAFSPDGARLALSRNAYGDENPRQRAGKVLFYEVASGQRLDGETVARAGQPILSLVYLPDGGIAFVSRRMVRMPALAVELGELVLRGPDAAERVVELGREPMVKAVRPSPDGRLLLVSFEESPLLRLYDREGHLVHEIGAGQADTLFGAGAFSADGRHVAYPTSEVLGPFFFRRWSRGVGIWEVASGRLICRLAVRSEVKDFAIHDLAVSPDGGTLAVGYGSSYDGGVELWDLGKVLAR